MSVETCRPFVEEIEVEPDSNGRGGGKKEIELSSLGLYSGHSGQRHRDDLASGWAAHAGDGELCKRRQGNLCKTITPLAHKCAHASTRAKSDTPSDDQKVKSLVL